jgi:hypothetical protein
MGQYKQLEGTALVNAMNTIFDLIKSRQDREAKEADRVWEREKFERQQALEEKKLGQGIGVSSDVRTTNLLNQVATDAKSGTSLDDIMRKYSTQADPGEILRVYNTNSSWGPAKETVEELYKKYGVTPPTGAPEATGQGGTVIEQINRLPTGAERAGARAVYDLTTVIDEAMKKAEGTPTGPLSALGAQYSKLTGGRGATAQLEPALTEILRTIRKEATGVAFSPQEIKDLQKEVPAIFQQEATVRDNLQRLKQRMTNKLAVYSIVDEGVNNDPLGIR